MTFLCRFLKCLLGGDGDACGVGRWCYKITWCYLLQKQTAGQCYITLKTSATEMIFSDIVGKPTVEQTAEMY